MYGGVINVKSSEIYVLQVSVVFQENEGEYGGALLVFQSKLTVFTAEVSFVRNHAQKSGGAVYAQDSQIIIKRGGHDFSFVENEGNNGGAMILVGDSTIYLEANSSITFVRNHAYNYGGADDYTEDLEPTAELSKCFYGIEKSFMSLEDDVDYTKKEHITIEFYNNTAGVPGTAIYGGWVDLCRYKERDISQASVLDSLVHFPPANTTTVTHIF